MDACYGEGFTAGQRYCERGFGSVNRIITLLRSRIEAVYV